MNDEIEEFASQINRQHSINIAAEKVSGGYAIMLGAMGEPRQFYRTMSYGVAEAFLEGFVAGLEMFEVELINAWECDDELCDDCRADEESDTLDG